MAILAAAPEIFALAPLFATGRLHPFCSEQPPA
jgi:hypothetical protein